MSQRAVSFKAYVVGNGLAMGFWFKASTFKRPARRNIKHIARAQRMASIKREALNQ